MPRRNKTDATAQAFGKAVRAAREDQNLTLETVAGRIKRTSRDGGSTTLDAKYLQAIEQGFHNPTISLAVQIARALDASLDDLTRPPG